VARVKEVLLSARMHRLFHPRKLRLGGSHVAGVRRQCSVPQLPPKSTEDQLVKFMDEWDTGLRLQGSGKVQHVIANDGMEHEGVASPARGTCFLASASAGPREPCMFSESMGDIFENTYLQDMLDKTRPNAP
jgi:hypothetical protein